MGHLDQKLDTLEREKDSESNKGKFFLGCARWHKKKKYFPLLTNTVIVFTLLSNVFWNSKY